VLGWDPMQTPLEQLCNEMVDADIAMQARALPLKTLNAGPAAARRTAAGCQAHAGSPPV
jgi:hypothetical protein